MAQLPPIRAEIIELQSGKRTSPSEFQEKVRARAQFLQTLGIQPRDRVALVAVHGLDFLEDLFALIELRAVPCILEQSHTARERETIETMIRPQFFVDRKKVEKRVADNGPALPENTALIIFTSGTSSTPKAVVHKYENLAFRFEAARQALGESSMEVMIALLPLHFAHGLFGICMASLFHSRCLLLPPDLSIATFSQTARWVDEYGVTFLSGTPATWNLILRFSKPPQAKTLRRVQMASAHAASKLFSDLRQWAGCDVWNVYGTSETASWMSDYRVDVSTPPDAVGDGSAWGARFEILSPDQAGRGEVRVYTRSLFAGYLGDELKPRPFFDTKDVGWIDEHGVLRLEGRMVRVINMGGLKVSPEEVELRLRESSDVVDAFVLSIPSLSGVSGIGGLVVLREGVELKACLPGLIESLRKTLSAHKIPTVWKATDEIPRRSNGKPDLKEIGLQWEKLS